MDSRPLALSSSHNLAYPNRVEAPPAVRASTAFAHQYGLGHSERELKRSPLKPESSNRSLAASASRESRRLARLLFCHR
jgi:hypothetical protein